MCTETITDYKQCSQGPEGKGCESALAYKNGRIDIGLEYCEAGKVRGKYCLKGTKITNREAVGNCPNHGGDKTNTSYKNETSWLEV